MSCGAEEAATLLASARDLKPARIVQQLNEAPENLYLVRLIIIYVIIRSHCLFYSHHAFDVTTMIAIPIFNAVFDGQYLDALSTADPHAAKDFGKLQV